MLRKKMGDHYFSIRHIAEMAMHVEEDGHAFYCDLARFADAKDARRIFSALAEAELKHKEFFRGMAETFRDQEEQEYSIDLAALMQGHMDKLKESAFNLRSFLKKKTVSIQDALNAAIHAEAEAVRVYTEISVVFVEKFRKPLEIIINEEKKHLEILNNVKGRLREKRTEKG